MTVCVGGGVVILARPGTGQVVPLPTAPDTVPPPPATQAVPPQDTRPSIIVVTDDTTQGDSVRAILERDFDNGDRIRIIVLDSVSRVVCFTPDSLAPVYEELARYNTSVALRVLRTRSGVRVALFDVPRRRLRRAASFHVAWDSLGVVSRMDVHRVADEVERWITGVRGIAATRVAYVQNRSLHVIDSDGANDQALTVADVALSPAWHPSGTSLVYSDLTDGGTQIARMTLPTRKVRLFTATQRGLNITPVFTPRGDSVVYATAVQRRGESPRMVIVGVAGKGPARPFRGWTSVALHDLAEPTFSPDGQFVAFVASRPLYPQIYTMRTNGTDLHRLVPYKPGLRNERTAPDWSPDGTRIAYQQQNRKFQIWIAQVRHGVAVTTTRLTSQGENQDPSWAPDGRHLVITSTHGGDGTVLWVVDTQSGRWRRLTMVSGGRLAAWSPRLGGGVQ